MSFFALISGDFFRNFKKRRKKQTTKNKQKYTRRFMKNRQYVNKILIFTCGKVAVFAWIRCE